MSAPAAAEPPAFRFTTWDGSRGNPGDESDATAAFIAEVVAYGDTLKRVGLALAAALGCLVRLIPESAWRRALGAPLRDTYTMHQLTDMANRYAWGHAEGAFIGDDWVRFMDAAYWYTGRSFLSVVGFDVFDAEYFLSDFDVRSWAVENAQSRAAKAVVALEDLFDRRPGAFTLIMHSMPAPVVLIAVRAVLDVARDQRSVSGYASSLRTMARNMRLFGRVPPTWLHSRFPDAVAQHVYSGGVVADLIRKMLYGDKAVQLPLLPGQAAKPYTYSGAQALMLQPRKNAGLTAQELEERRRQSDVRAHRMRAREQAGKEERDAKTRRES